MSRIYLSAPDVGLEERRMLLEAFDSNWIAPVGPDIDAFESELAAYVEVDHAVAVSSGTAALHLILHILGIGPGDEVLVPSFTFIATAAAVHYVGARPVFIDCSSSSWNLDPNLVADEFERRSRTGRLPAALITVDLYGRAADYDVLEELCSRYGVPLIEDCAEALGSRYHGTPTGSFGIAGAFSFNGNKIITSSGGGMIVTSSAELASQARHLATQAREPFPYYEHNSIGFNYRLSNLLAALGRAQLHGLPERMKRRRAIHDAYRIAFDDIAGIEFMPVGSPDEPNYWLTCVLIDAEEFGCDSETLRLKLEASDIESRPVWKPLHLQPVFANSQVIGGEISAEIFSNGLCLPSGSGITDDDVAFVIDSVRKAPRL